MEEIKVGDYVRINHMYNNQKIARIEKILDKDPCYKNMQMYQIDTIHQHSNGHFPSFKLYKEDIIKHSPNLIDLIKVGDLICYWYDDNYIHDWVEQFADKELIEYLKLECNEAIKWVATKEQINQVKYEV